MPPVRPRTMRLRARSSMRTERRVQRRVIEELRGILFCIAAMRRSSCIRGGIKPDESRGKRNRRIGVTEAESAAKEGQQKGGRCPPVASALRLAGTEQFVQHQQHGAAG